MKKCPTCEKTFDDNMKFCQSDGTPLVEVQEEAPAQPEDPYKTTVAKSEDLPIPSSEDPYKTMVAGSADEAQKKQQARQEASRAEEKKETPPPSPFTAAPAESGETAARADESVEPAPEPPKFSEPELSPPNLADPTGGLPETPHAPSPGSVPSDKPGAETPVEESAAPAKDTGSGPFGAKEEAPATPPPAEDEPVAPPTSENISQKTSDGSEFGEQKTTPIPSPFESSMPGYEPPSTPMPPYKEAEIKAEQLNTPFAEETREDQQIEQAGWNPPPAPATGMQDQPFGQDSPFQPPPAGIEGENKTLAIIALVCGILSIPCCGFLTGIPALIVGFIAKNKAESEPQEFGGRGLALAGMITGGIGTVLSFIVFILQIIFGALGSF